MPKMRGNTRDRADWEPPRCIHTGECSGPEAGRQDCAEEHVKAACLGLSVQGEVSSSRESRRVGTGTRRVLEVGNHDHGR